MAKDNVNDTPEIVEAGIGLKEKVDTYKSDILTYQSNVSSDLNEVEGIISELISSFKGDGAEDLQSVFSSIIASKDAIVSNVGSFIDDINTVTSTYMTNDETVEINQDITSTLELK